MCVFSHSLADSAIPHTFTLYDATSTPTLFFPSFTTYFSDRLALRSAESCWCGVHGRYQREWQHGLHDEPISARPPAPYVVTSFSRVALFPSLLRGRRAAAASAAPPAAGACRGGSPASCRRSFLSCRRGGAHRGPAPVRPPPSSPPPLPPSHVVPSSSPLTWPCARQSVGGVGFPCALNCPQKPPSRAPPLRCQLPP